MMFPCQRIAFPLLNHIDNYYVIAPDLHQDSTRSWLSEKALRKMKSLLSVTNMGVLY